MGRYIVVSVGSKIELEKWVNVRMEEGYIPLGSHVVIPDPCYEGRSYYQQAMVLQSQEKSLEVGQTADVVSGIVVGAVVDRIG